ncbi:MAG: sensor histidine kinase [Flavisolibacter sp.]
MRKVITGLQEYIWLNEKFTLFHDVDLNQIVKVAAERVMQECPGVEFILDAAHLGFVEGDPEQLGLLFYHLLSNAVKFRKEDKAMVHIRGDVMKQNKFRSVKNRYQYEDFLRVDIRDEGTGFKSEFKETIFELFRKLHHNEGQGLGLALCKKIVENHGGVITADSKVNLYTEIKIWLPIKQSVIQ